MRVMRWVLVAALAALMLGGCTLFANLFNQPPTVSLSAASSTVASGATVLLTATASDPNGDPISYTWYEGSTQLAGSSSTLSYSKVNTGTSNVTATVSVNVSDGRGGTASASVTLTITPPPANASFKVINDSSYTVWNLFLYPHGAASMGNDQLGSSTISPGNSFTVTNVPPGTYDSYAQTQGGSIYWGPHTNWSLISGGTTTWTLY